MLPVPSGVNGPSTSSSHAVSATALSATSAVGRSYTTPGPPVPAIPVTL